MSALAEALVAAQAELPCALGKDADGQIGQRSYRYLTLDKLIAETRPVLNKHGIALVQTVTTIAHGDVRIPAQRTTLFHSSGEPTYGDDMPLYLGDKTMQGLGAAITYARRYAWQSVLGIAAEEDTDGPAPPPAEDVPF